MANEEHVQLIKQGANAWNRWREDNPLIIPDLEDANLASLKLKIANFERAELGHAFLSDAEFIGTNLIHANLEGAYFNNTRILQSNLTGARLQNANLDHSIFLAVNFESAELNNATLIGSTFINCNVAKTKFHGACIASANFLNMDLSFAEGFENVTYFGPSAIGIDTLYKSRGKIPESFLRGCGIPDEFITFLPSLLGSQQAIQYHSCFISYSQKNEDFAKRLHSRMRDEHLRVWFAPEDMKGGEKLHEQIERAIQVHDRLLIVLSEHSMQSEWVMTEIRKARKAEARENRRKLFPIRLVDYETLKAWQCFDSDSGKDLAEEVRSYFIPDFSQWKDQDSFEASFSRLLRDLKA